MLGKLIYLSKNGEEKGELPVINLHFFIGSDLFCDLRIRHKDIAAQHCMITSQKDKPALIRNLSRTVPTLVNNTEIGTTDVELKDQDVITVRHKNYKWRSADISEPSTSSQATFSTASKNRKSWPLFKNKLVAVVNPQRRDEGNVGMSQDVQVVGNIELVVPDREIAPPKRRRGTIAGVMPSMPKIVALKTGLRATKKISFGRRKSSAKTPAQVNKTPQLARKSVKFLDTSVPRLGKRGWKSTNVTPHRGTPSRPKVSLYSTPASNSTLRLENGKPAKGILKTPARSSSASRTETNQEVPQHIIPSIVVDPPSAPTSPLGLASKGVEESDDVLKTPTKMIQPEVVMRSSRRRAAFVISPPSTPKSTTKKRKSAEEKSIEASERAAKRLKSGPPHAIDEKKKAALLQCHRKSLTPHPQALKKGKLITKFPSSFNRRLITSTPSEKTALCEKGKTNLSRLETLKYESVKFSNNVPKVFRFSSLEEPTIAGSTLEEDTSPKEVQPVRKKKLSKFGSKTSPIRKITRASKAAHASRLLERRAIVDDVLIALDLSRKWPSPTQANKNISTSSEVNLSGLKKLFNIDKALDVRELFLENSRETNLSIDKSLLSLPEEQSNRKMSRSSAVSKASTFNEQDQSGLINSFFSEGAQEQPCSSSLLSPLSGQSYSSMSRRSLSLKSGRKSTLSPNDSTTSLQLTPIIGELSKKQNYRNSDNEESFTNLTPRKATRSQNVQHSTSIEKLSSPESSNTFSSVAKPSGSRESEITRYSTPLNKTYLSDITQLDNSSVFSLGSFNSSHYKSRISDSCSSLDDSKISINENDSSSSSVKRQNKRTPIVNKSQSTGRVSLRRVILKAATPKQIHINKASSLIETSPVNKDESTAVDYPLVFELSSRKTRSRNSSLNDKPSGKLIHKIDNRINIKDTSCGAQSISLPLMIDSSVSSELNALSSTINSSRVKKINKKGGRKRKYSKNKLLSRSLAETYRDQFKQLSNSSPIQRKKEQPKDSTLIKELSSMLSFPVIGDVPKPKPITILSSDSQTTEKRGRTSKLNSSLKNTPIKKRSRSLPLDTSVGTPDKDESKANVAISPGKKGRPSNRSVLANVSQLDTSTTRVTRRSQKSFSVIQDVTTLEQVSILSRDNQSTGKRGITSKVNSSLKNTPIKKRSHSLPLDTSVGTQDKDESKANVAISPGKKGRPSNRSVLANVSQLDTSTTRVTRRSQKSFISVIEDVRTPDQISILSINSLSPDKHGRTSKANLIIASTPLKKHSRSLSLNTTVDTAEQDASKVDVAISTGKRSGTSKESVIANVSQLDISIPVVTRRSQKSFSVIQDETTSEPTSILSRDSQSARKHGRTSKANSSFKSTSIKKLSSSLPLDTTVGTPEQDGSKANIAIGTGERNRTSNESVLANVSQLDTSTTKVTRRSQKKFSVIEDVRTPQHNITLLSDSLSTGKRGRTSKVNSSLKNIPIKKRSHSLPLDTSVDTPKQDVSKPDDSINTGERSRPSIRSVLANVSQVDTSTTRVTRRSQISFLMKEDVTTSQPDTTLSSDSQRIGKRGRSSNRNSIISSPPLKKRSRSLPLDTTVGTPEQDASKEDDAISTGKKGRPSTRSTLTNVTQLDTSTPSVTKRSQKRFSVIQDVTTPEQVSILSRDNQSTGKSGRISKLNSSLKNTPIKKRSRSVPLDTSVGTQDKDESKTNVAISPGKKGRTSNQSVLANVSQLDISSPVVPRHTQNSFLEIQGVTTPEQILILSSDSQSIGKRGRSSNRNSIISSPPLKKRSRSLPLDTTVDSTMIDVPKADVSRRGRQSKRSVLANLSKLDTSTTRVSRRSQINFLVKEVVTTPQPDTTLSSDNENTGKRDSSNKANSSFKNTKTPIKKPSSSLPLDTTVGTIEQDGSIGDLSIGAGERSKTSNESVLANVSQPDISTTRVPRRSQISFLVEEDATTPQVNTTLSNDNQSTGKRGRSSNRRSIIASPPLKQRSRTLPSDTTVDTPKLDVPNADVAISPGKRSRTSNGSTLANVSNLDTSTLRVTRRSQKSFISVIEDVRTPEQISILSINSLSPDKHGRTSKLNSSLKNTPNKKRSRSLPLDATVGIPEQDGSKANVAISPGKKGSPSNTSVLANVSQLDTSTTRVTRRSESFISVVEDVRTPQHNTTLLSDIQSTGKRGRPSKVNSNLKNTPIKKQSQSMPLDTSVGTPELDVSKGDNSIGTGGRSRTSNEYVLANVSQLDTSTTRVSRRSQISFLVKEDVTTPQPLSSDSQSTGKHGRTSKLNSSLKNTPIKKRSRSLPLDATVGIPEQDGSKANVAISPGKKGRPSNTSVLANVSQLDTSTTRVTRRSESFISVIEDVRTPQHNTTLLSESPSTGKRGRSSNRSSIIASPPLKKRSCSLPLDATVGTPEQDASKADVAVSPGKEGRPTSGSVLANVSQLGTSTPRVTRHSILSGDSKSTGKGGRPSEVSSSYKKASLKLSMPAAKKPFPISPVAHSPDLVNESIELRRKMSEKASVSKDLSSPSVENSFYTAKSAGDSFDQGLLCKGTETSISITRVNNSPSIYSGADSSLNKSSFVKIDARVGSSTQAIDISVNKFIPISPVSATYTRLLASPLKQVSFSPLAVSRSSSRVENGNHLLDPSNSHTSRKGRELRKRKIEGDISDSITNESPSLNPCYRSSILTAKSASSSVISLGATFIKNMKKNVLSTTSDGSCFVETNVSQLTSNFSPINSGKCQKRELTEEGLLISPIENDSLTTPSTIQKKLHIDDSSPTSTEDVIKDIRAKFISLKSKSKGSFKNGTHSSTPIVPQNNSGLFSSGIQKYRVGGMRSPAGISPIASSDEYASSPNDHLVVSSIGLPSPKLSVDRQMSSKGGSFSSEVIPNATLNPSISIDIKSPNINQKASIVESSIPVETDVVLSTSSSKVLGKRKGRSSRKGELAANSENIPIKSQKSTLGPKPEVEIPTSVFDLENIDYNSGKIVRRGKQTKKNKNITTQHLGVNYQNSRQAVAFREQKDLSYSPTVQKEGRSTGKEVEEEHESVLQRRGRSAVEAKEEKNSSTAKVVNSEDKSDKSQSTERRRGRPKKVLKEVSPKQSHSTLPPPQKKGRTSRNGDKEELVLPSEKRGRLASRDRKDLPSSPNAQMKGRSTRKAEKEVDNKEELKQVVQRRGRSAVATKEEKNSSDEKVLKEVSSKPRQPSLSPAPSPSQKRGRLALRNRKDLPSSPNAQMKGRSTRKAEKEVDNKEELKQVVQRRGRSAVATKEEKNSSDEKVLKEVSSKPRQPSLSPAPSPSQKRGRLALRNRKDLPSSPNAQMKGRSTRKAEKEVDNKEELKQVVQRRGRSAVATKEEKNSSDEKVLKEVSSKPRQPSLSPAPSPSQKGGRLALRNRKDLSSSPNAQMKGRSTRKAEKEVDNKEELKQVVQRRGRSAVATKEEKNSSDEKVLKEVSSKPRQPSLSPAPSPSQKGGRLALRNRKDLSSSPNAQMKGRSTRKAEKEIKNKEELTPVMQRRGRSAKQEKKSPAEKVLKEVSPKPRQPSLSPAPSPSQKRGRLALRNRKDLPSSPNAQMKGRSTRKAEKEIKNKEELTPVMQIRGRSAVAAKQGKKSPAEKALKEVSPEPIQSSLPPAPTPSKKRGRLASKDRKDLSSSPSALMKGGRSTRKAEKEQDNKEELKQVVIQRRRSAVADSEDKSDKQSTERRGRLKKDIKVVSPKLLPDAKKSPYSVKKDKLSEGGRGKTKTGKNRLSPEELLITKKILKVSDKSRVIKSSKKVDDKKTFKSVLKKTKERLKGDKLKRLSRKSSIMGFAKVGKKTVHFNPEDNVRFIMPDGTVRINKPRKSSTKKIATPNKKK